MHCLVQEPVCHARIIDKPERQTTVAWRPGSASPPFQQQPRADAGLAPIRIHQTIKLATEIPLFHL